jgi:hypothetical protein
MKFNSFAEAFYGFLFSVAIAGNVRLDALSDEYIAFAPNARRKCSLLIHVRCFAHCLKPVHDSGPLFIGVLSPLGDFVTPNFYASAKILKSPSAHDTL